MPTLRNAAGFSTVEGAGERHYGFQRPLPMDYQTLFEDFIAAASGVPAGWTHTNTNGTLAIAAGTNLTQTLGGADNDLSQLYATTASFTLVAGKPAFFRWRGKIDKGSTGTVNVQEIYIGMSAVATGTNFIDAGGTALAVDDFVGFASYAAGAQTDLVARKTDVQSSLSLARQHVDATVCELAWDFDGATLTFWKDTTYLGQLTSGFPTAALAPMLYVKAAEAKAPVLTTDYIFFANAR